MESPEEAKGSNSSDTGEFSHAAGAAVIKGKRTKRQKLHSPAPATSAVPDSSSAYSAEIEPASEEEDMANCLILLAQGHTLDPSGHPKPAGTTASEKFISRRFAEAATTTDGKAGYYVYECKTCNKCFPSFQALGGHRASHKKNKLAAGVAVPAPPMKAEDMKPAITDVDMLQMSINSFSRAMAASNPKPKVHECSICGAEFSSGQALGGHMRRHRPLVTAADHPNTKQEERKNDNRTGQLCLDLNLPAPSSDDELLKRPASPDLGLNIKQPIVLISSPAPAATTTTSSALVDCHY